MGYSRADNAFHRQIAVASNNRLFLIMADATGETLRHYREAAARLGPAMLRRSLQDHEAILSAIVAADPELLASQCCATSWKRSSISTLFQGGFAVGPGPDLGANPVFDRLWE